MKRLGTPVIGIAIEIGLLIQSCGFEYRLVAFRQFHSKSDQK
jgi:hypothetical protein